ncbi:reverse transcriptase domain-containing protein [Pantoea eucalypti]|uniref:reverse transcriptase domain-containing protein n=1 Tax=Pantoea eucalypti TaxID=470933 RepID=UPI001654BFE2|nr:reverse transcriptase domain-containing protein [Pantoea eucalypti]
MKEKISKIDKNFYIDIFIKSSFQKEFETGDIIPLIANKEVSIINDKNKTFYSLAHSSPHYSIQTKIEKFLLKNIPLNASSFAYRKDLSYLHYLEPHIQNVKYCHLDIVSFFNSIDINLVRDTFSVYFSDEFLVKDKQSLLDAFIASVTFSTKVGDVEKTIIPMGFKSSPSISNIIFRKMDILIQKFCDKNNITYSRYADDLLFSTKKENNILSSNFFINEIGSILSINSFKLNKSKYLYKEETISLGGYVIENTLNDGSKGNIRLSSSKLNILHKALHEINKGSSAKHICNKVFNLKIKEFTYKKNKTAFEKKFYSSQLVNKLLGYRSYLLSFVKFQNKYKCINPVFLEKCFRLINEIENIINKNSHAQGMNAPMSN